MGGGAAGTDCDSRKLMTDCVAECLANNPLAVASHWQQQYRSHFTSSAYILDQLASKTFAKKIMGSHEILHNVDQMESLVEAFQEYNSALTIKGGACGGQARLQEPSGKL